MWTEFVSEMVETSLKTEETLSSDVSKQSKSFFGRRARIINESTSLEMSYVADKCNSREIGFTNHPCDSTSATTQCSQTLPQART